MICSGFILRVYPRK